MYVIDTDLLSLIQRGGSADAERVVARIEAVESDVYVTIVSFEEQMRGWLNYLSRSSALQHQVEGYPRLYQLIDDFHLRQVLLFTREAAEQFQTLRRLHCRLGTMDLKIAAIAIDRQATVITRNRRDFGRIGGLQIADWSL